MGKRRHSAKTGDKKLYARRKQPSKVILDLVENSRSSLAPDHDVVSERPLDEHILTKHQVLDLGVSDESSKGEYVSDDESMEDVGGNPAVRGSGSYDYDSDEGGNRGESIDPRRWGKKKSSYYDADTGDLEIGQDEQVRVQMHKCVIVSVALTLVERTPSWKKQRLEKCRRLVSVKWIKAILFFQTSMSKTQRFQKR
jgi:hypothetical protein